MLPEEKKTPGYVKIALPMKWRIHKIRQAAIIRFSHFFITVQSIIKSCKLFPRTPRLLSLHSLKHNACMIKSVQPMKISKAKIRSYCRIIVLHVLSRFSASQHPRPHFALFATFLESLHLGARRACVLSMHRSC